MATGSSFSALSRRARRGTIETSGSSMPTSAVSIGTLHDVESVTGGAQSVEDDPLAFLGDRPVAPRGASAPIDGGSGAASIATAPAVARERSSASPPNGPTSTDKLSRVPGTSAFSGLANARANIEGPQAAPREYHESAFGGLAPAGSSASERAARRDVHAVKVVTRLVRAIAFKPGTAASAKLKSAELQTMLADVHRTASAIAIAAAPLDAHRGWVHAMCSEAMAELVAARSENDTFDEPVDLNEAVRVIAELFEATDSNASVAKAVDALRESGYVEATTEAVATDRVRVSFGLACWDLYDNVTHPRLGVDAFRYTYDRPPGQIVALLSEEAMKIAREMNIRIGSLDMRTAHLQGSIRRVAMLLGAEYVNRTRQIMNWIGEEGPEEEYQRRLLEAQKALEATVIPEITELARRNFIAIEQLAPRLLEESRSADDATPRQNAV